MMLDATAGNRMMWKNKNPPNVVFIDRETRLAVPPDIFADNRHCPFRDGVFDCILYDPPHLARPGQRSNFFWGKPKQKGNFYGLDITRRELISSLHWAQKEFQRLSNRLCLKWSDYDISLESILPFFRDWKIINKQRKIKTHTKSKCSTWWITLVKNSEFTNKGEKDEM